MLQGGQVLRFLLHMVERRTHTRCLSLMVVLASGCLELSAVPMDEESCAERRDPDPLVGTWEGDGVCEFFSNGRYADDCKLTRDLSGFPDEWSRLDDGRYYFGTSSLGSHAGECLAEAKFSSSCDEVVLEAVCNRTHERTVELKRRE